MNAWELVESEFNCPHSKTEIRYKDASNGQRMYKLQCLNCGAGVGQFIKHADIPSPALIQPFDDRLSEAYTCLKRDRRNDLNFSQDEARQAAYDTYMQSPEWKQRRFQVLARDKHTCQACLKATATDAHHLNYDHFGNEPLFDLIAVCRPCHEIITTMDRSRRNGQR